MSFQRGFIGVLCPLLLLLLSACAGGGDKETAKIACPQIYILKDTDRVARFLPDGEKPSLKNLVFEARSTFGDGQCNLKHGNLSINFAIGAYVQTTPLFDSEQAKPLNEEVEMFVGVRGKDGEIISRQAVAMQFTDGAGGREEDRQGTPLLRAFVKDKSNYDDLYPENLLRISSDVKVNIHTQPGESPRDYKIYIGFLITESEFAYNRNGYLPNF